MDKQMLEASEGLNAEVTLLAITEWRDEIPGLLVGRRLVHHGV